MEDEKSALISRRMSPIVANIHRCESLKLLEMVAKLASISPNSDTRIRNKCGYGIV